MEPERMKNKTPEISRRRATGLLLASTTLLPLSALLRSGAARAEDLPAVAADDPTAVALKYVEDATKATRADKMGVAGAEQFCENCQFVQGNDGDARRPCLLFPGKSVNAKGWCNSWAKKA
jgi:hypothetical protein